LYWYFEATPGRLYKESPQQPPAKGKKSKENHKDPSWDTVRDDTILIEKWRCITNLTYVVNNNPGRLGGSVRLFCDER